MFNVPFIHAYYIFIDLLYHSRVISMLRELSVRRSATECAAYAYYAGVGPS